jgi:hypothetical protein
VLSRRRVSEVAGSHNEASLKQTNVNHEGGPIS